MTIGRLVQLEKQERMSKVILRQIDNQVASEDMDFIMKVAILGLVQGFCDKTIEDAIRTVMASDISHKKKRREIQKMLKTDNFFIHCQNVKTYSQALLSTFKTYVNDGDLERIWLVIDRFLCQHILEHTFVTITNTFLNIFSDMPKFGNTCFDLMIKSLIRVNDEVVEEYKQKKKEDHKNTDNQDFEYIFEVFERTEMDKARDATEKFFSVFKTRYNFERYAEAYRKKLKGSKLEAFNAIRRT